MSPYAESPEPAASVGAEEAAECAEIGSEGIVHWPERLSGSCGSPIEL
ncbi:MAG: hypothetical protein WCA07_17290 [Gloeobacterales cyanobacterium]